MLNFAAGNNFHAGSQLSDLMKEVEMAVWSRLREASVLSPHANNFSSAARLSVHKEHETLCHNVVFFPQLNTKNAVNEQTQRPSINPGDKEDQHAASCLGQVGVYSEQVIQEVNMGVVQIQPILDWNLYLNVIVKNGTTWQSRKDLLPFSVVSANPIPADNINHLQFLKPIFLLTLTIISYHVVPKCRKKICCCYCCCNLGAV